MSKHTIPVVTDQGMDHRSRKVREKNIIQCNCFILKMREGKARDTGDFARVQCSYKVAVPRILFRPSDLSALYFLLHHAA